MPCRPTSGNDCVEVATPPPRFEFGFLGLVTVSVNVPAFAAARYEVGTVMVSEVPAALAVPVSGVFSGVVLPKVTCVEPLNPVPVIVICCAVVAPAISPRFGVNEDCVGTMLSMFVASGAADLSVVFPSLGSATVALFVTLGNAPVATETVSVNELVPPAAESATPVYVHVTTCAFCAPATQAQPEPVLETKLRPAGNVSVTTTFPLVGPVPPFVTLSV